MNTLRGYRFLPGSILVVAALALSGCGGVNDDGAQPDPRPTEASAPSDGPVDFVVVDEFSDPRMRAEQPPAAVLLAEDGDVAAWLEPFDAPDALVTEVSESVAGAQGGDDVYGLLLGTGCERPSDHTLTRTDGEITLRVTPVKSTVECFAPMTYLTVVTVDETT